MNRRSLLACFAHPDDEAFGSGGALAHYSARGVRVELVCATRGEAGEIADPSLATKENLASVREQELRCAGAALGLEDIVFLGYRDSGMAGTAENDDPRAFVNAPAEEVVHRLVRIIRQKRPQVVLTFEPGGGYGHPDHIAIHRHTVAAFQAAADPSAYPEDGQPWQAARLYYTAIPRSFFRELKKAVEEEGIDVGDFFKEGEPERGWPDEEVDCAVDVSDVLDAKWAGFQCHRTQLGPVTIFGRLPAAVLKSLLGREHFAQAWPQPPPVACQGDLFAGVD